MAPGSYRMLLIPQTNLLYLPIRGSLALLQKRLLLSPFLPLEQRTCFVAWEFIMQTPNDSLSLASIQKNVYICIHIYIYIHIHTPISIRNNNKLYFCCYYIDNLSTRRLSFPPIHFVDRNPC